MKNKFQLIAMGCALMFGTMFIQPVQGQFISYGVKGGLNIANIGGADALETSPKNGFHAGGFFGVSLLGIVAAETGVYYSQKGYNATSETGDIKLSSAYLDIPLVVKFSPFPLVHLFAGPQFSYLLSNKLEWNGGSSDSTEGLRQLDMAIVAGVGMNLPMGLRLSAGYDYGFTSRDDDDQLKEYNRVIKLTVGYKF